MSPQPDFTLREELKASELHAGNLVWLCRVDPDTNKWGMATMRVLDVSYAFVQLLCTVTGDRFYAYRGGTKREELLDSTKTWLKIYEYREWE